ncbi:MAG: SpoIIE family protein phosphatase [Spirochaetia bacterium]|nr:SpoIIE family protein phosphatase [Spirochaetia bacterium]
MKKLALFLFLSALASNIEAENILKLNRNVESYNLGSYLNFYQDDSFEIKFEDILKSDAQGKFLKKFSSTPAFGFINSAVWAKITIDNTRLNKEWLLLFDYALISEIDIFIENQNGSYKHIQSGIARDINTRYVFYRKIILPLDLAAGTKNVYFRFTSENPLDLPIRLISPAEFEKINNLEAIILGIYYGITLVMIVYNLLIFFSVKDKNYLYYILYITFYCIVQLGLDGYLSQIFYGKYYLIEHKLRSVSASLAIISAIFFTNNFLLLKKKLPAMYKILKLISYLCMAQIIIALIDFTTGHKIIYLLMFLSIILFVVIGVSQFKTGRQAQYFFAGWIIFLISALIYSFRTIGIYIPYMSAYGMQIGSIFIIIILALALAHKIKTLNEEREKNLIEALKNKQILLKKDMEFQKIALQNQLGEKERSITRGILEGLIPQGEIHKTFFSSFISNKNIGGDFFDVFKINKNKTAIFMSQTSKVGLTAAILSILIKITLNNLRTEKKQSSQSILNKPVQIIKYMTDQISDHIENKNINLFYGIYDNRNNKFEYVNSGFFSPIALSLNEFKDHTNLTFINKKSALMQNDIYEKRKKTAELKIQKYQIKPSENILFFNSAFASIVGLKRGVNVDIILKTEILSLLRSAHKYKINILFAKIKEIMLDKNKYVENQNIFFINLNT